jgi:hypothetical protein
MFGERWDVNAPERAVPLWSGTAADAVGDHRRDDAGFTRSNHSQVQEYR